MLAFNVQKKSCIFHLICAAAADDVDVISFLISYFIKKNPHKIVIFFWLQHNYPLYWTFFVIGVAIILHGVGVSCVLILSYIQFIRPGTNLWRYSFEEHPWTIDEIHDKSVGECMPPSYNYKDMFNQFHFNIEKICNS